MPRSVIGVVGKCISSFQSNQKDILVRPCPVISDSERALPLSLVFVHPGGGSFPAAAQAPTNKTTQLSEFARMKHNAVIRT